MHTGIFLMDKLRTKLKISQMKKRFNRNMDTLSSAERLSIIVKAAKQVGPGVFYSNLVVIISFLPVFLLTGMEGKLFNPLAWTKTFILVVDGFMAIMLTPVLISFLLKGKLKPESSNPIVRNLEKVYVPLLRFCMKWRKTTIVVNMIALV